MITLLDQETINKIAAGEVVDRPGSVVKELAENAMDAGAAAITVEIKEGGTSFIRITDNGCGIAAKEVPTAFLRHSTSKIKCIEDLMGITSLGFRGEALSSIAAVSRVELITKTYEELSGTRYLIEGSKEIAKEEVGAPEGTTFLVRDLFYNMPARKKFLKTPQTEGNYISDLMEKLALSHPDISFKYINNNQTKLHTSGNGNVRELIYHIFGRDIAGAVLPVSAECEYFTVSGFIGKPIVTRANRNYETYFINGRYIKSQLLSKAIEEAYKNFMMQHQYPFTVLYFQFHGELLDVNVHPAKMELRFEHQQEIYQSLYEILFDVLSHKEFIPEASIGEEKTQKKTEVRYREPVPEPFEKRRIQQLRESVAKDSPYEIRYPDHFRRSGDVQAASASGRHSEPENLQSSAILSLSDISPEFLNETAKKNHRIIGQVFKTYWLIEFEEKLFIIDQHAAHEKVLFERTMAALKEKDFTSQAVCPPIIVSLNAAEQEMLEKYRPQLERMGYSVESFGGKEYMINGVPDNLFSLDMKDLFLEMLDDFSNLSGKETPDLITEKIASMSCKAAVKGNHELSYSEIEALIDELLTLENPYNCPHGRPTIISMSKYELEKKFKRIV